MKLTILLISLLIFTPKPRKSFTIEVTYKDSSIDTIQVTNIQSPLCIASYKRGYDCLICGDDSVIVCNVKDYRVINGK